MSRTSLSLLSLLPAALILATGAMMPELLAWSATERAWAEEPRKARTRLEYSRACARSMGPIRAFNCIEGIEIPITRDGVRLTTQPDDRRCDNPPRGPRGWDCMPYSRIVDLSPPDKANIITVALCRKDHPSQLGATNPYFPDIAVIQHDLATGETCFFQSPQDDMSPITRQLDGRVVPSPQSNSALAAGYWAEPAERTDDQGRKHYALRNNCVSCHDSNPFIVSPWIKQALATASNGGLLKKIRRAKHGKYVVDTAIEIHGDRPWVFQYVEGSTAKCAGCHRFGGGSWKLFGGRLANFHGFMPPGDNSSAGDWAAQFQSEINAIDDCLRNEPSASCGSYRAATR